MKISDLTLKASLSGNESLPLVDLSQTSSYNQNRRVLPVALYDLINGNTWIVEERDPTESEGTIDDWFMNLVTATVYQKTGSSTWTTYGVMQMDTSISSVNGQTVDTDGNISLPYTAFSDIVSSLSSISASLQSLKDDLAATSGAGLIGLTCAVTYDGDTLGESLSVVYCHEDAEILDLEAALVANDSQDIALTWTPVSGITTYELYYSTNGTTYLDYGLITLSDDVTGAYTVTGLNGYTTYYFYIVPVQGTLEYPQSNKVNIMTPPVIVQPTVAVTVSGTAATLTWNVIQGASSYQISMCVGGGCTSMTVVTTVTAATYYATGLLADTTYRYVVLPLGDAFTYLSSDPVDAVTGSAGYVELQFSELDVAGQYATIRVQRIDGNTSALNVGYTFIDNTAELGTDYLGVASTLSWDDLDSADKLVKVPLYLTEGFPKSFYFKLTTGGSAAVGDKDLCLVRINDKWDPILSVRNLAFLLDHQSSKTISSGSLVSSWSDRGPIGGAASITGAANQPSVLSAALNDEDAVRFDGTDDYLSLNATDSLAMLNGVRSIWSFVVVRNLGTAVKETGVIQPRVTTTSGRYVTYYEVTSSADLIGLHYRFSDSDGAYTELQPQVDVGTDWIIVLTEVNTAAGIANFWLNGMLSVSTTTVSSTWPATNIIDYQFARLGSSTYSQIDLMAASMGAGLELLGHDRQRMIGYAADSYQLYDNLPTSHLFKDNAPWQDPYWEIVRSLLRTDGYTSGTTIFDEVNDSWTLIGTATTSRVKTYFGNGSVYLPNGAAGIFFPTDSGLTLGSTDQRTIEMHFNLTTIGAEQTLWTRAPYQSNQDDDGWRLYVTNTGLLHLTVYGAANSGDVILDVEGTTAIVADTWYHMALVQDELNFTLYIEGQVYLTGTMTGENFDNGEGFRIGSAGDGTLTVGYFENFRDSLGKARYSDVFQPPIAPYPVGTPASISTFEFDEPDYTLVGTSTTATVVRTQVEADRSIDVSSTTGYLVGSGDPYSECLASIFEWTSATTQTEITDKTGIDWTLVGTTAINPGGILTGLRLTGSGYATTAFTSAWNLSASSRYSIDIDITPTELNSASTYCLFSAMATSTTTPAGFQLLIVKNRPTVRIWNSSGTLIHDSSTVATYTGSPTLTVGVRSHLAFCQNTRDIQIYKDGTLIYSSDVSDSVIPAASIISVGADPRSPISKYFKGSIFAFRATIGACRYHENFVPPAGNARPGDPYFDSVKSLIRTMDESAYVIDDLGNSWTVGSTLRKFYVDTGPSRFELNLDGTADSVCTASMVAPGTGAFTLDAWVKPTVGTNGGVFGFAQPTLYAQRAVMQIVTTDGVMTARGILQGDDGTAYYTSTGVVQSIPLQSGEWYHIEFSRDDTGNLYFFVDGQLSHYVAMATQPNVSGTVLKIGYLYNNSTERYYEGSMTQMRYTQGVCRHTAEFHAFFRPLPLLVGEYTEMLQTLTFSEDQLSQDVSVEVVADPAAGSRFTLGLLNPGWRCAVGGVDTTLLTNLDALTADSDTVTADTTEHTADESNV